MFTWLFETKEETLIRYKSLANVWEAKHRTLWELQRRINKCILIDEIAQASFEMARYQTLVNEFETPIQNSGTTLTVD
jgi:hypothetical protein